MTRQRSGFSLFAVIVALCSQATLLADVTGSILGAVTDAYIGGRTRRRKITVTNQDTNQSRDRRHVTDGLGQYRLLALPTGRYKRAGIPAPGFQTAVQTNIVSDSQRAASRLISASRSATRGSR
jgi:hypothetical protein